MVLKNGEVFSGTFDNDNFLKGVEIIDGFYNGRGIIWKSNGDIFEGLYENGIFKEGKAKLRAYDGEMKNNAKEGFGK